MKEQFLTWVTNLVSVEIAQDQRIDYSDPPTSYASYSSYHEPLHRVRMVGDNSP